MTTEYINGSITVTGSLWDEAVYDINTYGISVSLDGKGGIKNLTAFGDKICFDGRMTLGIFIDGKRLPATTVKKVSMLGRKQVIEMETDKAHIEITMFARASENTIYEGIKVQAKEGAVKVQLVLYVRPCHDQSDVKEDVFSFLSTKNGFSVASNQPMKIVPQNEMFVFESEDTSEYNIKLAMGFDRKDIAEDLKGYSEAFQDVQHEIDCVSIPKTVKTERDKALYMSCYFCGLENYIEKGDFKCFLAGCRYVTPLRTYFRDAYFTVLSMYNGQAENIRNQILTLIGGVSENYTCPSAVVMNGTAFWGNHFDSPSLLCIMLYDYVNNTGDRSILSETVKGKSVYCIAENVLMRLSENADKTGLLVKAGGYNRRDWADEVNRHGYVTYDEILYARALFALSKLSDDSTKSQVYFSLYEKVKGAINTILWDEELSYYVNFRDGEMVEDNLSIDTVLAVLYGVADKDRGETLLHSMQKILESKNHSELRDFGVMCVYPLYDSVDSACNKSACYFDYHNGSEWPFWSALYAYALKKYGMDYEYALTRWFDINTEKGNYTPVEYHSAYCLDGSLLQAWSSLPAFVYYDAELTFFDNKL